MTEGFDEIQAPTSEGVNDAGSAKKGAKSSCQAPLIIPCSLLSLSVPVAVAGWVRSPAGHSVLRHHRAHRTEPGSPWNRTSNTASLRNGSVLSRLLQQYHCSGELGRSEQMRVCSASGMDFLLCV